MGGKYTPYNCCLLISVAKKRTLHLPLIFLSGAGSISQSVSLVSSELILGKSCYFASLSPLMVVTSYLASQQKRLVFAELFLCLYKEREAVT